MNENIVLLHADCIVQLESYPDDSIDCVITDPPYFIDKLDNKWNAKAVSEDKPNSHIKHLPKGMKFGQAVLCPVVNGDWVNLNQVGKINKKERGSNGFGSTGLI